jgi:hypothetical protein
MNNKQPDTDYHDIEELEPPQEKRKKSRQKRNDQDSQQASGNNAGQIFQEIKEKAGNFYDNALDYQIKFEPLIIAWLVATFLIETIRFDHGAFFFGVLMACGMAYLGIKAHRTKNKNMIYAWLILMALTCIVHLFDSFKSKRGRPWNLGGFILEFGLVLFELFLMWVMVKLEILMGNAETLRDVLPERKKQNAPENIVHYGNEPGEMDFDLNGRKNTAYSEK